MFHRITLFDSLLNVIFPRSQYGITDFTREGIQVRSRAEKRIATYFVSVGLRYEYEKEITAGFLIFKRKVGRPDFYLPDQDVYVEFWGLLDAPNDSDRKRYARRMKYKLARYQQLGIKCISLYPQNLNNLDRDFRRKFKDVTGTELP